MRWGYAHELGPFELWDALGVRKTVEAMEAAGITVAEWVKEMLGLGYETFYRAHDGMLSYYDQAHKKYIPEALDERKIELCKRKAAGRVVRRAEDD
jgi:3-hydroxyacyl-CoA dehydrogenase